MTVLSVNNLSCSRAGRLLFSGLSWQAKQGDLIHITGENGSGKTSLLLILSGFLRAQSGRISWDGYDLHKKIIPTFVGHELGLAPGLSVKENARFYAHLMQGNKSGSNDFKMGINAAMERLGLLAYQDEPIDQLSRGTKQRLALIRLVFSQSPLWLLDEPATGLDAVHRHVLTELIQEHGHRGGVTVMSSHQRLLDHWSEINLTEWLPQPTANQLHEEVTW